MIMSQDAMMGCALSQRLCQATVIPRLPPQVMESQRDVGGKPRDFSGRRSHGDEGISVVISAGCRQIGSKQLMGRTSDPAATSSTISPLNYSLVSLLYGGGWSTIATCDGCMVLSLRSRKRWRNALFAGPLPTQKGCLWRFANMAGEARCPPR